MDKTCNRLMSGVIDNYKDGILLDDKTFFKYQFVSILLKGSISTDVVIKYITYYKVGLRIDYDSFDLLINFLETVGLKEGLYIDLSRRILIPKDLETLQEVLNKVGLVGGLDIDLSNNRLGDELAENFIMFLAEMISNSSIINSENSIKLHLGNNCFSLYFIEKYSNLSGGLSVSF